MAPTTCRVPHACYTRSTSSSTSSCAPTRTRRRSRSVLSLRGFTALVSVTEAVGVFRRVEEKNIADSFSPWDGLFNKNDIWQKMGVDYNPAAPNGFAATEGEISSGWAKVKGGLSKAAGEGPSLLELSRGSGSSTSATHGASLLDTGFSGSPSLGPIGSSMLESGSGIGGSSFGGAASLGASLMESSPMTTGSAPAFSFAESQNDYLPSPSMTQRTQSLITGLEPGPGLKQLTAHFQNQLEQLDEDSREFAKLGKPGGSQTMAGIPNLKFEPLP